MVATIVLATGRATSAHPQAAPDRNNRYVKLTPMADRLRLAYTVYLGDQPGAEARRRLDRDRDGTVDDREATVVGDEIAALVEPAVDLTVDGQAVAIDWATIDVGLGTPSAAAGALSVDLIGWACAPGGTRHELRLRDRIQLDRAGEVELKLEEGPGIAFGPRRLGGEPMPDLIATARVDDGRLAAGLELTYQLDPALAVHPDDRRCRATSSPPSSRRVPLILLALAAVTLATTVLIRRRRSSVRD
jgi:hypothetical protein